MANCELCKIQAQLQRLMDEIGDISDWFPLFDAALIEAVARLSDAYGYASHEHDEDEVTP